MSILANIILLVIIPAGLFVGLCFLQVYLSKKTHAVPGLVLPCICLVLSLITVISLISYSTDFSNTSIGTDSYEIKFSSDGEMDITNTQTGEAVEWVLSKDEEGTSWIADKANGNLIIEEAIATESVGQATSDISTVPTIWGSIVYFILANIPTAVFFVIYGVIRSKMRSRAQLDKMAIQDL